LAKLRDIAAGGPAIPLVEILSSLEIPLTRRPHAAPRCTPATVVTVAPTVPVHVAADEQRSAR